MLLGTLFTITMNPYLFRTTGFFCNERASYHPSAAADAWSKLTQFLQAGLKATLENHGTISTDWQSTFTPLYLSLLSVVLAIALLIFLIEIELIEVGEPAFVTN